MSNTSPLGGHRMVLAIMDLADDQTAEMAKGYEEAVILPNMPWAHLNDARQRLWEALIRRAQRGEIVIRGVVDATAGAVTISPDALRGSKPDFLADTLTAAGMTFHSVGVFDANTQPTAVTASSQIIQKGRGGRAPAHDWTRVAAEVVRIAHMEELGNRRLLVARMTEWCATNLDTHPDPSTVRKYINDLCPADLPAE